MLIAKMVNNNKDSLSKKELIVAEKIASRETSVIGKSITIFAAEHNMSIAAVNKLCMKIGATGWKDLKSISILSLSSSFSQNDNKGLISNDNIIEGFQFGLNLISEREKSIKKKAVIIADRISNNKKTIIFSSGYSKNIADSFVNKINRLGFSAHSFSLNGGAANISKDDHLLFFSLSWKQPKFDLWMKQINKAAAVSGITLGHITQKEVTVKMHLEANQFWDKTENSFPIHIDVLGNILLNLVIDVLLKGNKDWINEFAVLSKK